MRMKHVVVLVLVLLICLPTNAAHGQGTQKQLLVGLIPEMNIFKQKARYSLLGDYLSKKVGVQIKFTILSRYGNIIDRFEAEKMDAAFFGSFTGAAAIYKLGVVPIARPINPDNTSTYQGYIFVRKDSGIRSVADMRGKKMAFVEKATTAGYIFPLAYLREKGISSIDGFFQEYYFAGSHDAAIDAVLTKKADIGAAKNTIYNRLSSEDPRIKEELLILAESPPVPSNGLCVRKDFDPALRKKLKDALLALHNDAEGRAILKRFGALRFIETSAADYEPVHVMSTRAGIDLKKYNWQNQ